MKFSMQAVSSYLR